MLWAVIHMLVSPLACVVIGIGMGAVATWLENSHELRRKMWE